MNDTTTTVVVIAAVVVAVLFLRSRQTTTMPPKLGAPPPGTPTPGEFYRGNDLGPFGSVTSLPGLKQAYDVLAPVNDKVIQPFVSSIRNSAAVTTINDSLGGKPTTVVNDDGSITRRAPDSWYSKNIGSPISSTVTGFGHAITSIF